jgi:glutamate/tyrosine decarboxylase-like PLP-dependent enzyme
LILQVLFLILEEYFYHNPLHVTNFKSARFIEAEVIEMTGAFFSDKPVYGITTSGGTDSICHAIYAYREWGRARGINIPNMYFLK